MPREVTARVRAGKTTTVVVHPTPVPAPAPAPAPASLLGARRRRVPEWGELLWRFENLGGVLATAPRPGTVDPERDLWNTWEAMGLEAGPFPTPDEIYRDNDLLAARADAPSTPLTYLYSGRELEGQGLPLGAVDIVSGYNATLGLARHREPGEDPASARPDRLYALQHNAPHVHARRTAAEQLADWDALRPLFEAEGAAALARWQLGRDRIERLALERFSPYSARLEGRDLALRATGLPPGLFVPRFTAGDQFHDWAPENTAAFRCELVRTGRAPVLTPPLVARGRRTTTRTTCRLVPRRHRYLFSWTAIYVVAIVFTAPVLVAEVNIGTHSDLLPLDWAFVGAEDEVRNDAAISRRIPQRNRYAVAINQDLGSQVFSSLFFKVLVGRDDGQWCVREGDRAAGELAAVLDVDRGGYDPRTPERGGQRDRYRISRKTSAEGGRRINFGKLATQEVTPYHESGQSIWPQSVPYGGL